MAGRVVRRGDAFRRVMERLPGMERAVLDLRFGISEGAPVSRSDIAGRLNITAREVGEIEARGLDRLRQIMPEKELARMLADLTAARRV